MTEELCTLNECPPGLFMFNGHLGFKSEYTTTLENPRRYQVDAYVVESGEYFWGGAKSTTERGQLMVEPVTLRDLMADRRETLVGVAAKFGPILKAGFPESHSITRLQVANALAEKVIAVQPDLSDRQRRASPQPDLVKVLGASKDLREAIELLCDWMNNNDLVWDHADQKPDDFQRLCDAMEVYDAALMQVKKGNG